jgi:vancomycin resistance protein YoaR
LKLTPFGKLRAGFFFATVLGLVPVLTAQELARFSCQRPEPLEAGSVANAAIACTLVDGKVLQPGASFSFNHAMTPGLNRFVEGTSYSNGKVLSSEGGGVCQVTSALYNAALVAGLPILERYCHSIYDPQTAYVPAGRDCAISRTHGADFRFRNSTAAPLSISAKAEGGRVEVVLYGVQADPRARWIVTQELARDPHRVIVRENPRLAPGARQLKQKGFDGLSVRRQLCTATPEGLTECASLGRDDYLRMAEIWEQGPAAGATP